MMSKQHASDKRFRDRGISLLIIAVSMIFILGMAGLAIDLASLYVGRSQAQRAADAAALAGAQYFTNTDCTVGANGGISAQCQAIAMQRAEAVGDANLIAGVSPSIQNSDVTFPSTSAEDPQIQVIAARDTSHGNPMPTFFVKIFGINTANVSAKAVAEAYIGTGTGQPVGATCVKPWLIPNCDPGNKNSAEVNSSCAPNADGSQPGMFVDAQPNQISSTLLTDRNVPYSQGGVVGEPFTLKPGSPGSAGAPGQYYAAFLPNDSYTPTECPACAGATPSTGGTGSAAIYRENIECCNQNPVVCGPNNITLSSAQGNMVGPTNQGVKCLIRQSGSTFPTNCGQDYLQGVTSPCANPATPQMPTSPYPPFKVVVGPNSQLNTPNTSQDLTDSVSPSLVTLPIWDGTPLQSGQNSNLNIVGFLQIFLQDVNPSQQGTVYGTVIRAIPCGAGGSGNGTGGAGGALVGSGSAVPVRLITP
ncbi:MAG: pilus assembly protein TadG-related protein [Acidobacteriota bacterium]